MLLSDGPSESSPRLRRSVRCVEGRTINTSIVIDISRLDLIICALPWVSTGLAAVAVADDYCERATTYNRGISR